jgi:hypothetical protein
VNANVKKIALLVLLVAAAIGAFIYNSRQTPEEKARIERAEQQRQARAAQAASASTGGGPASPKRAGDDVASQFDVADVDIDRLLQNIQDVDFQYNLERLSRDPMSPLIGLQARGEAPGVGQPQIGADERLLHLARLKAISGIVWDDRNPFAVIDNEVVTQGYVYPDGILLDEIHPDYVVFRVNDARVEVELKEQ